MAEDIVRQIMQLKTFIITAAAGNILLTAAMFFACRRFTFRRKNLKLVGFLFDMGMRDTFMLATALLKVFFVLSLFIAGGKTERIHVLFFGVLAVVCSFWGKRVKDVAVSLFNGTVMTGVLFLASLLASYLRDVLFDFRIAAALVVLAVFLMLYALYDLGCSVLSVVEMRRWDADGVRAAKRHAAKAGAESEEQEHEA